MNYKVEFDKRALRKLKKMDAYQKRILLAWIKKNLVDTENPRQHGKALVGKHKGLWRYQIGEYRLISHIDDEKVTILILEIGHRSEIYN